MASRRLYKIKKVLSRLGNTFICRTQPIESESETEPVSEPKPVSKASAAATFLEPPTIAPTIPTNISETAPVIVETPTLNQSNRVEPSLWNRAYDNLKEKDKKLVEIYEELLSRELQTSNTPKNGIYLSMTICKMHC